VTPIWITRRVLSEGVEEREKRSKEQITYLQKIAGPDSYPMIVQKGSPTLPSWLGCAISSDVLLDGPLTYMHVEFQQFPSNPFSSPESILRRHLPHQSDGFWGYLRLMRTGLRSALPDQAKELPMEALAAFLVERVMWACFQVRANLASSMRSMRSALQESGRFTCRLRMMSCWRKRAFSAISWDLLLLRSVSAPSSNEGVSGFVQRTKRG
jgi:hypothetical protein